MRKWILAAALAACPLLAHAEDSIYSLPNQVRDLQNQVAQLQATQADTMTASNNQMMEMIWAERRADNRRAMGLDR